MKSPEKLVRAAAILALAALALMVLSVLDPRPVPVVGFMTFGQGLGTLSFLLYLGAVVVDLRRVWAPDRGAEQRTDA